MDARDVLVARAMRDFDEGLAHARARIHAGHGRVAAATLDALVMGAVRTLDLRDRMAEDVAFLVDLARRVAAGEDPERVAAENVSRVLRLDLKMRFLARQDDPAFQRMLALVRAHFGRRLPDLARMATVEGAADYDDLVRRAFPDRARVDLIVAENRAFAEAMLAALEGDPHVLRIPQRLVPRIVETAREVTAWQVEKVMRGVDDIYAHPAPQGGA